MIIRKLELGPFATNCYIVGSETTKEGIIIDPCFMPEEILKHVKELGLTIKIIMITHAHIDHVSALSAVKEATGASVAIHEYEVNQLRDGNPLTMFGMTQPEQPKPERLLKEGDSIDVGDLHFSVIHTPGHTPGGICLLEKDKEIVFTGDTLFQFSVGRSDFPGGSHDELIQNIRNKLLILPDNTTVCPGHGPDTTIGVERRVNPFL